MATHTTGSGLRADSLIDLKTSFSPTIALSAKRFDQLDLNIRSFREPLKRSIQHVIAPSIGKNFLTGGRPTSWTPLSDVTLEMKGNDPKTRYPVSDPLLRSGLLFKTMQQFNIWTVTETQAAILQLPSKIWYGNLHQAGHGTMTAAAAGATSAQGLQNVITAVLGGGYRAYIPQRPFAMIQSQDMDAIAVEFEIWMNERIIATLGL